MYITWNGHSSFKIQGDKVTVVTDPYDKSIGLTLPRLSADIVTISHDHDDHNNSSAVKGVDDGKPFIIEKPGEYEIKEVFIYGIPSFHDDTQGADRGINTIYRIEIDGISIAHLGDLGHDLEPKQLERLEGVDIVMIPVGGTYTIDAKQASSVISKLEPRIVIPMHYHIPSLKLGKKIDGVENFKKELGVTDIETTAKFKVAKKDLPQDRMKMIIFEL